MSNLESGNYGEELACKFLKEKGYRIDLVTVDFTDNPERPRIGLIKDITSF